MAENAPAGQREAMALALLLAGTGATHFVRPGFYDAIVPRWLPGAARGWTYLSGAAELAVAAAITSPRTRRAGGLAAAALFAAVFPANVQMASDWRRRPAPLRAVAIARLPLQAPLIWWALRVRRAGGNMPSDALGDRRRLRLRVAGGSSGVRGNHATALAVSACAWRDAVTARTAAGSQPDSTAAAPPAGA